MALSENSRTILAKRYLQPNETPEQLFERVARVMAQQEEKYGATPAEIHQTKDAFNNLMYSGQFLPNSPTLANAGARTGQLSACFVLPVPDDLGGIFEAMKQQALIHQTGGGTGFSFSRLRGRDALVKSSAGKASGPLSFMDVFNAATESIKQGGMRRGANMGILRIDHPDVMDFIRHKEDLSKLTNFNISVAVTSAFMTAVESQTDYALIEPSTGLEVGRLDAVTVFKEIVLRAWSTGEPGIVFIDRMNQYCPVPWMGEYEATNPCGEQPLIPYESCNLGSINLEKFVDEVTMPDGSKQAMIAYDRLRGAVRLSIRFLDNVIDANRYPIPQLKEVADATRKIGLGVMGFARMLYKLSVPYGSEMSNVIAEQVFSFIDYHSKLQSIELAAERGQFPARDGHEDESNAIYERWFFERHNQPNRHVEADYLSLLPALRAVGIRNSTTTTIAPTGTISMIADTSGGCEPQFALVIKRFQADTHMTEVDPVFLAAISERFDEWTVESIVEEVVDNHGSLKGLGGPADLEAIFVTSHDVTPAQHIGIQAAFQKYNDSATSKTINFAESATVEDVEESYMLAWKTGCKGVTVYRNNSRQFQPLATSREVKPAEVLADAPVAVKEVCGQCGSDSLIQTEGCVSCTCCAWSACSVA